VTVVGVFIAFSCAAGNEAVAYADYIIFAIPSALWVPN
jgi:hypothetical protein